MKEKLKKWLRFLANPRLLLCLSIAWLITNGWSYLLLGLGSYFGVDWMVTVASAYLAFLWLPISPEKLVTIAIAIFLLRKLFPNDTKTLGVLKELHEKHRKKKAAKKDRESQNQRASGSRINEKEH